MVLRVQSCKVLLSALQDLAEPLLQRFLGDEPPQFDSQVTTVIRIVILINIVFVKPVIIAFV